MHLLAFLIAGFSVSIAALFSENSDPANLSLLDSLIPGSSSLNPSTPGNEPSPFQFELAQEPSTDGAGESSIINPSITYTEAPTHTDDSTEICNSHDSDGQKRRRSESSCAVPDSLFRLRVTHRGEAGPSDQDKKNKALSDEDTRWLQNKLGPDLDEMSGYDIMDKIITWNEPGRKNCEEQEDGETQRPHAICCLGPEQEIIVPTLGYRLVRREEVVKLLNVWSCDWFMDGRPYCQPTTKRYCCADLSEEMDTDLGFKGLDCVRMEWFPEIWPFEVILKAEKTGVAEDSADIIFL